VSEKEFKNRPTIFCNHTGKKIQVINIIFSSAIFSVHQKVKKEKQSI